MDRDGLFVDEIHMGRSLNSGPFLAPKLIRHPYKQELKRDLNLGN